MKVFKVLAKSLNTNSFGLHRMVLVAEDGTAFEAHASYLNVKEEGESMIQMDNGLFNGCEMVNQLDQAPQEAVDLLFND
jgi:hypothetical protein